MTAAEPPSERAPRQRTSGERAGADEGLRRSVALVGFMGVGKTSVGRALARLLKLRFVDTDDRVAAEVGPLPEVFAQRGEAGFRALERDAVVAAVEAAKDDPSVLALGGGAVLSGDVREALARLGHVVWLTAPPEVLWRRVKASGVQARPLAQNEPAFARLLREREPVYSSLATLVLPSDGSVPAESVAAEVARQMSAAHPRGSPT